MGAYYICWRGDLLIRRWAVQTSQEEPSRIISEVFPRLFRFIFNSQSWGRAALKLRTTQNSATIMGLLKSIWNGFGDLYDSVENTSDNNFYEDRGCYTRITWEGRYKCLDGFERRGKLDEILPKDEAERIIRNYDLRAAWIKSKLYDCVYVDDTVNFRWRDV